MSDGNRFLGDNFLSVIFSSSLVVIKYPPERGRPLSSLGLPKVLPKLDAAFVWGKNKHTYLFAGDQYWK